MVHIAAYWRKDLIMKRKITALVFAALLAAVLLLQGCSSDSTVAGKIYTYTVEPESGLDIDRFSINLKPDGTFIYYECWYSSYIGMGNWSVDGDVLTITDDNELHQNSFKIDGDDLVFIENGSTNFQHVKVADGEHFTSDGSLTPNSMVKMEIER